MGVAVGLWVYQWDPVGVAVGRCVCDSGFAACETVDSLCVRQWIPYGCSNGIPVGVAAGTRQV